MINNARVIPVIAFLFLSSCMQSKEDTISVCTKTECCCPESIEIDLWDGPLGLNRVNPKKLAKKEILKIINAFNAAKPITAQGLQPKYAVRAYYPGGTNPRVFEEVGGNIKDENYEHWFSIEDTSLLRELYQFYNLPGIW